MLTTLAIALAVTILVRCLCIAVKVSPRHFTDTHGAFRWHGFALSHVALGGAALFAVVDVWRTGGNLPLWLLLAATAGIVAFDPRRPQ